MHLHHTIVVVGLGVGALVELSSGSGDARDKRVRDGDVPENQSDGLILGRSVRVGPGVLAGLTSGLGDGRGNCVGDREGRDVSSDGFQDGLADGLNDGSGVGASDADGPADTFVVGNCDDVGLDDG